MKHFSLPLYVVIFALLTSSALARPEMAGKAMDATPAFTAMDKDNNSKVSPEEFFAAYPQMKEGAFTAIDTDKDGAIVLTEWAGFMQGHAGAETQAHPQGTGTAPASNSTAPDLLMPPKSK